MLVLSDSTLPLERPRRPPLSGRRPFPPVVGPSLRREQMAKTGKVPVSSPSLRRRSLSGIPDHHHWPATTRFQIVSNCRRKGVPEESTRNLTKEGREGGQRVGVEGSGPQRTPLPKRDRETRWGRSRDTQTSSGGTLGPGERVRDSGVLRPVKKMYVRDGTVWDPHLRRGSERERSSSLWIGRDRRVGSLKRSVPRQIRWSSPCVWFEVPPGKGIRTLFHIHRGWRGWSLYGLCGYREKFIKSRV